MEWRGLKQFNFQGTHEYDGKWWWKSIAVRYSFYLTINLVAKPEVVEFEDKQWEILNRTDV